MKKTKTLVSMVDFVLNCRGRLGLDNIRSFWACERHAKFQDTPLTLGQFVATDLEGNVLEEPKYVPVNEEEDDDFGLVSVSRRSRHGKELEEYQQAIERVVFHGFEVDISFKGWVCVTNGSVRLHFQKWGITIETIGNFSFSDAVETISDLTSYRIEYYVR